MSAVHRQANTPNDIFRELKTCRDVARRSHYLNLLTDAILAHDDASFVPNFSQFLAQLVPVIGERSTHRLAVRLAIRTNSEALRDKALEFALHSPQDIGFQDLLARQKGHGLSNEITASIAKIGTQAAHDFDTLLGSDAKACTDVLSRCQALGYKAPPRSGPELIRDRVATILAAKYQEDTEQPLVALLLHGDSDGAAAVHALMKSIHLDEPVATARATIDALADADAATYDAARQRAQELDQAKAISPRTLLSMLHGCTNDPTGSLAGFVLEQLCPAERLLSALNDLPPVPRGQFAAAVLRLGRAPELDAHCVTTLLSGTNPNLLKTLCSEPGVGDRVIACIHQKRAEVIEAIELTVGTLRKPMEELLLACHIVRPQTFPPPCLSGPQFVADRISRAKTDPRAVAALALHGGKLGEAALAHLEDRSQVPHAQAILCELATINPRDSLAYQSAALRLAAQPPKLTTATVTDSPKAPKKGPPTLSERLTADIPDVSAIMRTIKETELPLLTPLIERLTQHPQKNALLHDLYSFFESSISTDRITYLATLSKRGHHEAAKVLASLATAKNVQPGLQEQARQAFAQNPRYDCVFLEPMRYLRGVENKAANVPPMLFGTWEQFTDFVLNVIPTYPDRRGAMTVLSHLFEHAYFSVNMLYIPQFISKFCGGAAITSLNQLSPAQLQGIMPHVRALPRAASQELPETMHEERPLLHFLSTLSSAEVATLAPLTKSDLTTVFRALGTKKLPTAIHNALLTMAIEAAVVTCRQGCHFRSLIRAAVPEDSNFYLGHFVNLMIGTNQWSDLSLVLGAAYSELTPDYLNQLASLIGPTNLRKVEPWIMRAYEQRPGYQSEGHRLIAHLRERFPTTGTSNQASLES